MGELGPDHESAIEQISAEQYAAAAEYERAKRELEAMSKEERLEACRDFVNAVRAMNNDLYVTFYPHWMNEGQIMIGHVYAKTDHTKPVPKYYSGDFTLDELIAVLEPLGKVHRWENAMPWHFRRMRHSLDTSIYEQIIGERLREARKALRMDIATFYRPTGMTEKTARKWEAGNIAPRFLMAGERRFNALSEAHGIPLSWLFSLDVIEAQFIAQDEADEEKSAGKAIAA